MPSCILQQSIKTTNVILPFTTINQNLLISSCFLPQSIKICLCHPAFYHNQSKHVNVILPLTTIDQNINVILPFTTIDQNLLMPSCLLPQLIKICWCHHAFYHNQNLLMSSCLTTINQTMLLSSCLLPQSIKTY
jgi:hypothetical protein